MKGEMLKIRFSVLMPQHYNINNNMAELSPVARPDGALVSLEQYFTRVLSATICPNDNFQGQFPFITKHPGPKH
jgi:hypothetical protein